MKMNIKIKISRKILLTIFSLVFIISIVTNPLIQSLNLIVQSSQVVSTNPNINNGLSFQGSCLVNQDIKQVQAINSTGGLINAFQVNTTVFNFTALLFLFSPIIIYVIFEFKENKKNTINKNKKRD